MIKYASAIVKKWPPLHRMLRPMARYLNARAPVWWALVVNIQFPGMHDAAIGKGWRVRKVGARAGGREIVMLVVSDLRVDPRVEREARALASAGYIVTVICPESSKGVGATFNIDWGPGVSIRYVHWTGATFMSHKPGYHADLLYFAAVRMKPFAFHAHDLSTAYAALAAANVRGSHLIVDFHEWFSENVHWDITRSEWAPYPEDWKGDLRKLEARCLSEASATITVCNSIADAMVDELGGQRSHVIRNIPNLKVAPTKEYPPLKQQLGFGRIAFCRALARRHGSHENDRADHRVTGIRAAMCVRRQGTFAAFVR